nr:14727_t:CDS:2 [Entrophospora candida]
MQNYGSQKFTDDLLDKSKCENVKVIMVAYTKFISNEISGVIIWQGTDNDLLTRTLRELDNNVIGIDHGPGDSIGINDLEIQKNVILRAHSAPAPHITLNHELPRKN